MAEHDEAQAEHDEAQAIEGYGCTCGFRTDDRKEITTHVMVESARDGKGTHKSLGRINLQTGEVIVPPWRERTKEQKRGSAHGKHSRESTVGTGASIRTTDILADAQELRFVPRVYTTDYSPIIRAAQDAAVKLWGWRPEMPLGNFLDTCLFMFFEEKGVTLAGYIISEEAQKALEEAQVEVREEHEKARQKKEEGHGS